MGFLRNSQSPAWIPRYTGLQIQTSSNAVPITILYGINKIAPNVIWTGGFYSIPQYQKTGKGGPSPLQGYNYYTSFEMGLCEGPVKAYGTIWNGQTLSTLWSLGLWAFYGTSTQNPWPIIGGSQALNYKGLAYIAASNFPLGSSPNLPQFSFEVYGILYTSAVVNAHDADPALIVQDFLTNAQYGAGFPAASIDATTLLGSSGGSSYQIYCQASGLALSPALTSQEAANSILTRWLKLTNTAAVWSGGKLKFIPYGDTPVTGPLYAGGNVTFNPNITPIYNLADDDFIHEDGKDPLEIVRSDPYASYNWQRLHISQRSNYYDATPIDAFDQNAIELYGLRMASDITANEICDPKVGQTAAQLILQRQLYIRNTYHFKLSFEYCLLEPMDLVTVTDSGLGLNNVAVRITSIEEDDSGLLAVMAEEFPGGTATAVQYPVQTKTSNTTDQGVVPARVNTPIIFEPPASITGGIAKIAAAVSGGVATAYKLAEDSSTGVHSTNQVMNSSQASATAITFSVYAQTVERSALRLNFFNGAANVGCDFNLATEIAGTPDAGISATSITNVGGNWYRCSITGNMLAAATPAVYIILENPVGMQSYPGVAGDGVYIWGAAFAAGSETSTRIPAFSAAAGATLATNAVATPEGVAGIADPDWGGAFVWLSTDNATYGSIGTVNAPARQGVLTAALAAPSGSNPDIANTLSVTLIESGGALSSGTASDAQNGVTLCLVGNELLAYQTATLTGPNAYNLTYLYRGLYGTAPAAYSSGAPFARVDGAIFQYDLPSAFVGVLLYMKFQSFNIFGQAVEDLSECAVYTYTPTGAGLPLGPVAQALSVGTNLDYGLASAGVNESDDFGLASAPSIATIDMGLASS